MSGWRIDPLVELSYHQYADVSYGQKTPEQLKIAFFCGPEPENDVEILFSLEVKLENTFAFEKKEENFEQAVTAPRGKYPQLKIYNWKIDDFVLTHNTVSDIIYLDFTEKLSSCYKTICCILDHGMIAPLGVLAVNTT